MRRYAAVVFDLWDTLVLWPAEDGRHVVARMAELAGVEPDRFQEAWVAEYERRWTGALVPSVHAVCERLGISTGHADAIAEIRRAHTREVLVPRHGALDVLRELRRRRFRLGLISNCSADVEDAWEESGLGEYVDAPILSCSVGLRKPNPAIYRLVAARLEVEPAECLFVDDQPDFVRGALEAGMDAILLGEQPWEGPRIERLEELLQLEELETPQ